MSQAADLLASLNEYDSQYSSEDHIVITNDRFIIVPDSLKRIAVQHDHNIETVTFDCPRYWDEHDMSQMVIYINYTLPNGVKGQYRATNITTDELMIHFDWVVSGHVTQCKGKLSFLVCIVKTNDDGMEELHWNSEINQECYVSEGMECHEDTVAAYPDIITHLLLKMDQIEKAMGMEPGGTGLIDEVTGVAYKLKVRDGKLMMEEV